MHPKGFALTVGIVFLILGVLAFLPSVQMVPDVGLIPLKLEAGYGLAFGLFAMNVINKLVLIAFGLMGLLAYNSKFTSLPASIKYSRLVFAVMGALSILGMIPQTNTLFGYVPLYGNLVWEHGVFSLMGAYFGYALSSMVSDSNIPSSPHSGPLHGTR